MKTVLREYRCPYFRGVLISEVSFCSSTVFYPLFLSLSLQTYACLSRLKAQLRQLPQEVASQPDSAIFFERSVHSDKSDTVTDYNAHTHTLLL